MGIEFRLMDRREEWRGLRDAWDALVLGRGRQADLYDTATWLLAWCESAHPDAVAALRVAAAFDGDRLVAALPLLEERGGAWKIGGLGLRPRFRAIVAGELPGNEGGAALAAIAAGLASEGVKALELPALPERDPATAMLEGALVEAGYAVSARAGSEDCLAIVPDGQGWEDHRKRFKKFDRTTKNFANKAARLGEVTLLAYGAPGAAPAADGFLGYVALHGQGWKGTMKAATRAHREALIAAAGARGWARIYTLAVAGVPAASIVWFRLGAVAFAYSTVYEARLRALSAGTVVMWRAHEELFAEGPLALIDYLPGHGLQKDQLGEDRSGLRTLEASRKSLVSPLAGKLAEGARRALGAARRALTSDDDAGEAPETLVFEPLRAEPAGAPLPLPWIDLEGKAELFLACAGGHGSATRMREHWSEGDVWHALGGDAPCALVRLAASGEPREIVLLPGSGDLAEIGGKLAAALGRPIDAQVVVHRSLLPW